MDYWKNIWADFKNGSNLAFEKIYNKHIDILYRYGTKFTIDNDLVRDCIQQLFMELYISRKKITEPDNIEFYLLKALKRILVRRIGNKQKHNNFTENEYSDFAIELGPEALMIESEQWESKLNLINASLQSLSSENKELLFLKFYSGLTNKEIGLLLGIKPETIQKQIYRILKKLKVDFETQFDAFNFFVLFNM